MSPEDANTEKGSQGEWMPAGRPAEGAWPEPLVGEGGKAVEAEGRGALRAVCTQSTRQNRGEEASSFEGKLLSFWKDFHLIWFLLK